jgi:hypothetical protein
MTAFYMKPRLLPTLNWGDFESTARDGTFAIIDSFTLQQRRNAPDHEAVPVHRLIQRGLLNSSLALRHKMFFKTEIERFLKETNRSMN